MATAVDPWTAIGPYAATVIDGVQPAALDQPRVYVLLRRGGGDPLSMDYGLGTTFNIEAFYDTGASGVLLSNETADGLGVVRATYGGQPVVYEDVGVAGTDAFDVSEPLNIRIAPFHPDTDVDNIDTYLTVYNQAMGSLRMQIGPTPAPSDPLLQNLDVFGISAMQGKVVVMDPTPVDTFMDTMRTYVYNPGTPFDSAAADTDPGIPQTNRHIQLSYADFTRFTKVTPSGASGPTLADNPFIGPNPVLQLQANPPADNTPAITIAYNSKTASGSWLLDTGAAASIISRSQASKLGITYVAGTFGTDNPQLSGVPLAEQFTLTIGGIGGTTKVAGFFLDSLVVPTEEGSPIQFNGAPVLVSDIQVKDPLTSQTLTLDGIFGMNFLVASAFVTEGYPPDIGALTPGSFNWLVFDQPNGVLGVNLPGIAQDTTKPTASLAAGNVTSGGASTYSFTVTYADNVAVRTWTIDSDDVKVTGPSGFSQVASLVSVNDSTNGTPRTATYRISTPGGSWDPADNGTYTVTMLADQVTDPAGNAVNSGGLGSFQVSVVGTLPGSIAGVLYNDVNCNKKKDVGEALLANRRVYLDANNNARYDAGEATRLTDVAGAYSFTGLVPATYRVREVVPTNWRQTAPSGAYTLSLASGQNIVKKNFGTTKRSAITGLVFNDLDGDGVRDAGEAGLFNWRAFIDADNDGIFDAGEASVLTDANGKYRFDALKAGTYRLRVVPAGGWTRTAPAAGYFSVTLVSGVVKSGYNFGYRS
jgi:hypothetical protein